MYTIYIYLSNLTTNDVDDDGFVGQCDEDSVRLVKAAYEALGAAIALVKPGCLYKYVMLPHHLHGYIYDTIV